MRWYFAFLLTLWIIAAIAVTVIVFCITRNPFSFSLFTTLAPPVYLTHRLAKYLFPMSKEEAKLTALRIQCDTEKHKAKNTKEV